MAAGGGQFGVVDDYGDLGGQDYGDCCDTCATQCACSSLGLNHPQPELFVRPQTRRSCLYYMVYRILIAIYFVVWLVLSGTGSRANVFWLVHLNHWNFFFSTINLIVQAWVTTTWYFKHRVYGKALPHRMTLLLRVEWVLNNFTSCAAIAGSLIFYFGLYMRNPARYPLDAITIHLNIINSVVVLVDLFLSDIPYHLLHFYQPFLYMAIYFLFNTLYTQAGGTDQNGGPVYSILAWRDAPGTAGISLGIIMAGTIGIWFVLVFLHWMSCEIYRCCCPNRHTGCANRKVRCAHYQASHQRAACHHNANRQGAVVWTTPGVNNCVSCPALTSGCGSHVSNVYGHC